MKTHCLRNNWRWVVATASFVHTFLLLGSLYNYSILFLSFQREFNTGAAATGDFSTVLFSLDTKVFTVGYEFNSISIVKKFQKVR